MAEVVLSCPVLDCTWTLDPDTVPVRPMAPTEFISLDNVIATMLSKQVRAVETVLREHMEAHDVVDFLKTIDHHVTATLVLAQKVDAVCRLLRERKTPYLDGCECTTCQIAREMGVTDRG